MKSTPHVLISILPQRLLKHVFLLVIMEGTLGPGRELKPGVPAPETPGFTHGSLLDPMNTQPCVSKTPKELPLYFQGTNIDYHIPEGELAFVMTARSMYKTTVPALWILHKRCPYVLDPL